MAAVMINLSCFLDGIWNQLRDKPQHRYRRVFLERINQGKRLHPLMRGSFIKRPKEKAALPPSLSMGL